MKDLALILCVMAGIVALVAAISLCIAMMLWMIGLFGVGSVSYTHLTASAIDMAMNDLLTQQRNDDEIAKMRAEKEEMVKLKIDIFNSQYELNTPITFDDVAHKVMNVSISELDGYLADEFDKRLEIEMQAAKAHTVDVDKSEPMVAELPLPQKPMKFEKVEEPIRTTYVVKLTESQRKIIEDTLNKIGVEWSRI